MNNVHTKITNVLLAFLCISIWAVTFIYIKFQIDVVNFQTKQAKKSPVIQKSIQTKQDDLPPPELSPEEFKITSNEDFLPPYEIPGMF